MTQQLINVGTAANDGTGDSLRVGGQKINDNFTELYARGSVADHEVAVDPHPQYTTNTEATTLAMAAVASHEAAANPHPQYKLNFIGIDDSPFFTIPDIIATPSVTLQHNSFIGASAVYLSVYTGVPTYGAGSDGSTASVQLTVIGPGTNYNFAYTQYNFTKVNSTVYVPSGASPRHPPFLVPVFNPTTGEIKVEGFASNLLPITALSVNVEVQGVIY